MFLGSNGVSVNTGVKNRLITIVRQETPWVGFVWCLTHMLELALKDALKKWMDPISTCLQNCITCMKNLAKIKKVEGISWNSLRSIRV